MLVSLFFDLIYMYCVLSYYCYILYVYYILCYVICLVSLVLLYIVFNDMFEHLSIYIINFLI